MLTSFKKINEDIFGMCLFTFYKTHAGNLLGSIISTIIEVKPDSDIYYCHCLIVIFISSARISQGTLSYIVGQVTVGHHKYT